MILLIRGHIRNSFKTQDLLNLVKSIIDICPNLKIYIHTWNVFANNISWRHINIDNDIVTEDIIYDYFCEIKHFIKHIMIDDDSKIKLIGNLNGNINNGPMPIIGWKNYWYGKYKIIDYIYTNNFSNLEESVINFRFDIFNNSNNLDNNSIIYFIENNIKINFTKNIFICDTERQGIDNIYIGNINTMYKLIKNFHYDLDNILNIHNNTIHQEYLVHRLNSEIFN